MPVINTLSHPITMFGRRWDSQDSLDRYREMVLTASERSSAGANRTAQYVIDEMARFRQAHSRPSPRTLAARTKRSLKSARASIEKLALPYADIDNSVEGELDTLLNAFDQFEKSILQTVEWLEEPIGS